MHKKLYFGSNLKMYKTIQDTTAYLTELAQKSQKLCSEHPEIQLFILPSYTSLESAKKCVTPSNIRLGAQNMCWEDEGQFTGEISPKMLEELEIDLVMAGHSERRHIFGENDFEENKKILSAVNHNFTGLLCIGETAKDKEYGISDEVLRMQLKIGLHGITKKDLSKIWIAYEPVWSIGVNGTPAPIDYAEEKHKVIKATLCELYGTDSDIIPVLYGGSVNPDNAPSLFKQKSIDGLYIGRSAWNAEKFVKLIEDVISIV